MPDRPSMLWNDREIEQFLIDMDRESRNEANLRASHVSRVTCRRCGVECVWKKTPEGWRLFGNNGMHKCNLQVAASSKHAIGDSDG